jgi:hypothetical protein
MSGDPASQPSGQASPGAPQSPAEIAQRQQQGMIQAAFHGSVPRYYTNGITLMVTPSDICLVMSNNGIPSIAVTLSYPTAKQLEGDLQRLMGDLERITGLKIKSLAEMQVDVNKIGR